MSACQRCGSHALLMAWRARILVCAACAAALQAWAERIERRAKEWLAARGRGVRAA